MKHAIKDDAQFKALWDSGMFIADMARKLAVSEYTIKRTVKRLGLTRRASDSAEINEAKVIELLRQGESMKVIAAIVGTRQARIVAIRDRLEINKQPARWKRRHLVFVSAKATPRETTSTELQMIADYIASHGVTRLPAAALERTTATIPAADQMRLAAYRAAQDALYVPPAPRGVSKPGAVRR